jgi:hypothetical protein
MIKISDMRTSGLGDTGEPRAADGPVATVGMTNKPYMSHFSEVSSCDLNDRLRKRHIPLYATTLPYLSHDARAD